MKPTGKDPVGSIVSPAARTKALAWREALDPVAEAQRPVLENVPFAATPQQPQQGIVPVIAGASEAGP